MEEPSGVALTQNKDALWVVSDDKKRIFCVDLNGKLRPEFTIKTKEKELEGITLDKEGTLYIISEAKNKIIIIGADGKFKDDKKLRNMDGYSAIAKFFDDDGRNKGLEGITWREGSLFVLKESHPGLLIEISADLKAIKNYQFLNNENGFRVPNADTSKIDFSGICHDPSRQCFWILSDMAQCLFLYSWEGNQVLKHFTLAYEEEGTLKEIRQAEGVAYNSSNQHLYVVSDLEARLYVFEVVAAESEVSECQ